MISGVTARRNWLLAIVALIGCAFAAAAHAEETPSLKGVALVIGQSKYQHIPALTNPANDARDIVKLLTDMGFDARSVSDRDSGKLKRDLERFVEDAEGADVAFLYYSGHGIEAGGENWLIPVDADMGSLDNAGEALVPLSSLLDELKATVPVTILLLDACRTNPFPPDAAIRQTPSGSAEPIGTGGLQPVRGAKAIGGAQAADESLGTVIGFAAEPGRPALDGKPGENSPYAAALLRHLAAMDGAEFGAVMRMVTEEVYLGTRAQQRPWVNESLRRMLYFGVSPDAPTGDDALITGERRTLLLTIADLGPVNRSQVELAAVKDDVPLDALYGVLKALGTEKIPENPVELEKILDAQAERLRAMFEEQAALRTDDPEIARLTASADRALRDGAIVSARKFLDDAVARVESTSDAVDQAEELIRQKRLADAAIYAQRASASALVFDYIASADDYAKASAMVDRWDGKLARQYRLQEGVARAQGGFASGDRAVLDQAMAAYTAALAMGDAEIQRMNRATILNNIGLVQLAIGESETGTTMLDEAASTLREAVELAAADKDDKTWATAQSNLGNALLSIGKRGKEPKLIEDAVAAYRTALAKQDRATDALGWAGTQNNIGIALFALGDREATSGHLREAEATYRLALEVYSRESTPLEWAMVQNNLGNTLSALGNKLNDPAKLEEASAAFHAALEVYSREHFPLSWAQSRFNLGTVLINSTRFDLDTRRLEEARSALQDAMTVYTRKDFPLDWASAQNSLGSVLQTIGQRNRDEATLEESASAFRAARRIFTRKEFPLDWAMVHHNLGNTLMVLGGVSGNTMRYKEAVAAYRDALREYTREATPRDWAMSQAGTASALHWLSMEETGTESLKGSIEARRAALEVLTFEDAPIDWANAQNGLGMSLLNLGNLEQTDKYLGDAHAAFEASLKVFTREDQPLQWAFGQNNLGDIHWNRASFTQSRQDFEQAIARFELAKLGFSEAGYPSPIALTDKKIDMVQQTLAGK